MIFSLNDDAYTKLSNEHAKLLLDLRDLGQNGIKVKFCLRTN